MKQTILLLTAWCSVYAADITLTPQQQKDWHVRVSMPISSDITPKATFFAQVVTPPQLLKTLSLPYDATVTNLHVNLYDSVKHGDALVDVSSTQWLEVQKNAISNSIVFDDIEQNDNRKQKLCAEQIIAQKECIASHAELLKAKNALKASKEQLLSFGAKSTMIDAIVNNYKVYSALTLYSDAEGSIIHNSTAIGQSIAAFEPLMTLQKEGDLWLEGALSVEDAITLHPGDAVAIAANKQMIESKVINIAPIINTQNQTRNVRLAMKKSASLLSGLRTSATLYLHHKSLKIPKKALIKDGKNNIVFVQNKSKYSSIDVNILAEEQDYYFIEPLEELKTPIVVSSVAILKSMMESSNE